MIEVKRYLTILISILLFGSCANNEMDDINPIAVKNKAIGYRTFRDKASTRYANDNDDTYMVYALITEQSTWYFNTVVTPTSSTATGAVDTPAGTYYWPGTKEVQFFAYCPGETGTTTGVTSVDATITDDTPSILIDYTVPTTGDTDFTIATVVKQSGPASGGTNTPVALKFAHMLSKITIKVELSSTLIAQSYSLQDGYTADLTVQYVSGSIDAASATPAWTMTTPTASTTYSNDTFTYIILPQTYNETTDLCTVQIKDVVIKRTSATFFSGDLAAYTLKTTDITNATFEPGTQYNFVLTITTAQDSGSDIPIFNEEILFLSSMADWTYVDSSIDQP